MLVMVSVFRLIVAKRSPISDSVTNPDNVTSKTIYLFQFKILFQKKSHTGRKIPEKGYFCFFGQYS